MDKPNLAAATRLAFSDFEKFTRIILNVKARPYQLEPAAAILDSVFNQRGMTFVVEMSRQSGKNELSALIEAYLLTLYQRRGGAIVKASPTFKPQTVNSIRRLRDRLRSPWHAGRVHPSHVYIIELPRASAKSPWGATNAGFSGKTTIKRKDWGLNWNVALETGGWLVGDDIHIAIELEIVQKPEAAPAEAVAA
jgi:hypothetical protein